VRRRQVLTGLGALALAGGLQANARPRPLRVGVVGAGILGASVALHLADAGAHVTLFESTGPAAGATRNSYAWLNAFVDDPVYRDVRLRSLARWRLLDARYRLGIVWGGYLNWASDEAGRASVAANAAQVADSIAPAHAVDRDRVLALAPYLTPGPVTAALWTPTDGHLDPQGVTEQLLAAARPLGVDWRCPSTVTDLDFHRGRLRAAITTDGRTPLDRLVLAAGTATPKLAALAGTHLSLQHAPGILAHTRPIERFTTLTHEGPGESSFKQLPNGRIVAYDAPHPPDLPVHSGIRAAPMDFPSEDLRRAHGSRMLEHLSRFCPRLRPADLETLTLGFRPMPLDDRPIVGALASAPDVHVAVTHSGVTLAAILGRWVASEVVDGNRIPQLSPYRPERFR
jgi:glycine/D-amino acid oxidase-like deaminating enzyme